MTLRERLEAEIAEYEVRITEAQRLKDLAEERLTALPKEPARLRMEPHGNWHNIYGGDDQYGYGKTVANVSNNDCANHNIDPAALAAHICTFGQPAPDAIPAREIAALGRLELAVRKYFGAILRSLHTRELYDGVCEAIAALDAVRGVNP